DFADHPGRIAARQSGQIHRRLGVAGATQNAAFHGAKREHVAGHDEIGGCHLWINEGVNPDGAVVSGNAGRDAATGVYGDRERGAHRRRVLGDHHAQLELVEALTQHRYAHEPPGVGHHEVDGLGRDPVGRHHEVTLVFAILVVDDDEDTALSDLLDRLFDA